MTETEEQILRDRHTGLYPKVNENQDGLGNEVDDTVRPLTTTQHHHIHINNDNLSGGVPLSQADASLLSKEPALCPTSTQIDERQLKCALKTITISKSKSERVLH